MLFVQEIKLRYYKDARTPQCAAKRRALRFCALPGMETPSGEVLFHKAEFCHAKSGIRCVRSRAKIYDSRVFENGFNPLLFSGTISPRIALFQEGDAYRIAYCGRRDLDFYKTKFVLPPGEYGRVIFNERGVYEYTGIWYYGLITYNFVNAEPSACREKLFFRKEPDKFFSDLQWLRYSG